MYGHIAGINSKKKGFYPGSIPGLAFPHKSEKGKQAVVKAALFLYVHALDCGCDCLRN